MFQTYFDNPLSAGRGAQVIKAKALGRPPVHYEKHCPQCGKAVRPPSALAADFPGTIRAGDVSGLCGTCKYKTGRRRVRDKNLSAEELEERLERAKQVYADLVANRRARGIDPEGIQMPGEKPGCMTQADIRERGDAERNKGMFSKLTGRRNDECIRGHQMLWMPSSNRMRCYECERIAAFEKRQARAQQEREATEARSRAA